MTLVSIVIPTIKGREGLFHRSLAAFEQKTTAKDLEFIVVRDKSTCGIAWTEGIARARGDYVLLSADDIEPVDMYWLETGINCIEQGFIPCARVLRPDGSLETCGDSADEVLDGTPATLARVPFLSRQQLESIVPIIKTHYYTDNWISYRAACKGWPTRVSRDFCFYHHYAAHGRVEHRLDADRQRYERLVARLS